MPSISFKSLPSDYQEILSAFRQRISQNEKYVIDFENRHYNSIQELTVIYCFRHAIDLAKGCLVTAGAELPDSLTILCRAMMDTLFWTKYISLSTEYAQKFADSTLDELKRIARKNIEAGYAHITDLNSDDDKTTEALNSPSMKDIPKRIGIEDVAKQGGLESLYTRFYGFQSIIVHGRGFSLPREASNNDEFYTSISFALGMLECIEVIASDWIISRQQTTEKTLFRLLGI